MSDAPFSRTVINTREKPSSTDINRLQSMLQSTLMDILTTQYARRGAWTPGDQSLDPTSFAHSGFVGDGFRVLPSGPSMVVQLTPGIGFMGGGVYTSLADLANSIGGVSGVDDTSGYYPMVLGVQDSGLFENITIDAAPAMGSNRTDIIEVRYDRLMTELIGRLVMDPGTGAFGSSSLNKVLKYDMVGRKGRVVAPAKSTFPLSYKVGAVNGGGSTATVANAPSTTPGYIRIATVLVDGGATSIDANRIVDERPLLWLQGSQGQLALRLQFVAANSTAGNTCTFQPGTVVPPGVIVAALSGSVNAALPAAIVPAPIRGVHTANGENYGPGRIIIIAGGAAGGTLAAGTGQNVGPIGLAIAAGLLGPSAVVSGPSLVLPVLQMTQSGGLVNSTLQGYLAACSPSLKVAIGQPYYSIDAYFFSHTVDASAGPGNIPLMQAPFGAGLTLFDLNLNVTLTR